MGAGVGRFCGTRRVGWSADRIRFLGGLSLVREVRTSGELGTLSESSESEEETWIVWISMGSRSWSIACSGGVLDSWIWVSFSLQRKLCSDK